VSNPYGNDPYGNQGQNPYGQPGQYGAFPGGGDAQPAKTDGVSVAALVLSLLCCTSLIGAIMGFVGLKRTKNGQRKGRGLAIAAVVIGLLGTLAFGGAVALVVAGGAGLFGESVEDLETGQCLNADGLDKDTSDPVSSIKIVDCDEDHDGEVLATSELSADEAESYEFDDQDNIDEHCISKIDDEVLATLLDPKYYIIALTSSENPDAGDQVACVLTNGDGSKLTEKVG
jgi:hypothetical protein